jgi:hypothetical protein
LLAANDSAADFLETRSPQAEGNNPRLRIPSGAQIGLYVLVEFVRVTPDWDRAYETFLSKLCFAAAWRRLGRNPRPPNWTA